MPWIHRMLFSGLLSLWLGGPIALAQEADKAPGEKIVVMLDGRILRGQVHPHAVGYSVDRPGGSIVLAKDQIRCVARDIPDAYRQQREQMIDPTSTMLIQLAEWCISYRLYEEAGDELRRALRRDPENETARQMLAKLDEMLKADPNKTLPPPKGGSPGLLAADVEALGGLSRASAANFTARIQPLLVNKCGNGNCHGGTTEHEFRLTNVRNGSANHRRAAEMNLAVVLRSIDVADPVNSPLLQASRGAHGGSSLALFGGVNGPGQLAILRDWVITVAKERQAEEEKLASQVPLRGKKRTTAMISAPEVQLAVATDERTPQEMAAVVPAAEQIETFTGATGDILPAGAVAQEDDRLPGYDRPVRAPARKDLFDPELFNQKGRPPGTAGRMPGRLPR